MKMIRTRSDVLILLVGKSAEAWEAFDDLLKEAQQLTGGSKIQTQF